MKIYLLYKSSGSWDDAFQFVWKAYKDKEEAVKYCNKYNTQLGRLKNMLPKDEEGDMIYDSPRNYDIWNQNECRIEECELI